MATTRFASLQRLLPPLTPDPLQPRTQLCAGLLTPQPTAVIIRGQSPAYQPPPPAYPYNTMPGGYPRAGSPSRAALRQLRLTLPVLTHHFHLNSPTPPLQSLRRSRRTPRRPAAPQTTYSYQPLLGAQPGSSLPPPPADAMSGVSGGHLADHANFPRRSAAAQPAA